MKPSPSLNKIIALVSILITTAALILVLTLFLYPQVPPVQAQSSVQELPPRPKPDPPSDPGDDDDGGDDPGPAPGGGSGGSDRTADPAMIIHTSQIRTRVGDTVEFSFAITNVGDGVAKDVTVMNKLPPFLDLVQSTTSWGTMTSGNRITQVTCDTLLPGDTVNISILARVTSNALPPFNTNTVVLSSSNEKNLANNTATFVLWTLSDMYHQGQ